MTRIILFAFVLTLLFVGCEKEDTLCKTCGYYTPHKYEFTLSGDLISNCMGEIAKNKTIELHLFKQQDSIKAISQTDNSGHFNITYSKVMSMADLMYDNHATELRLIVKEDSITYFLPEFKNIDSLSLTLDDSFNLAILADVKYVHIDSTGFLTYWFGSNRIYELSDTFMVKGPILDLALIDEIKEKWRSITIDENGHPHLIINYHYQRSTNFFLTNNLPIITGKEPCQNQQDTIMLRL